jgi:hypothetical protein
MFHSFAVDFLLFFSLCIICVSLLPVFDNIISKEGECNMQKKSKIILLLLVWNLIHVALIFSQDKILTGAIKGKLVDFETKKPLAYGNVTILNTVLGAASDSTGEFKIENVPVGNYIVQFDFIGYETLTKTDIIVRSKRITFVNAELHQTALEMEKIKVTTGYFRAADDKPISTVDFSYEEIRRAPGSAGDVSRILMSLPAVAKVNDQSNNLIVRGGNPFENSFFIDNIEIPNINHFPHQGGSGGPIGMLNVDFIQDVNFYTGGFSAIYGDKLSSVMDITFREGNRTEFDGQLDLNFSGFGGIAEGPFFSNRGSWLLSARRSYLDFVVNIFDAGTSVAPVYGDVQGKVVLDLNPDQQLILLDVFADDHNAPDRKNAEENFMTHYGNQDLYQNTIGMNWRSLWKAGYSNSSFALTTNRYDEDWYETSTGKYDIKNRSKEKCYKFRNVNCFSFNKKNTIEFGVEAKYVTEHSNNWYAATTNTLGDTVESLLINKNIKANKQAVFASYLVHPFNRLTAILGLRSDYFSYNKHVTFSPRLVLTYQLSSLTAINGSVGIFRQNLPLLLLGQHEGNKRLKDPSAIHYILGINYLITENTRLTVEVYRKDYQNFPVDPIQPSLFIIDENFFDHYANLFDKGKALSQGIEMMVQKKLAKDFYGLASVAYFKSRYRGLDRIWRDRNFDNRMIFSFEGGYKPNRQWEFSMRWIYAGGVPYTPYDVDKSIEYHRAIYDGSRINKVRYPDYHSLNIRFDRRFHFSGSNLVFYLSIWNAYNRKNIANIFWNDLKQRQDEVYQWMLLPILGLEYEF